MHPSRHRCYPQTHIFPSLIPLTARFPLPFHPVPYIRLPHPFFPYKLKPPPFILPLRSHSPSLTPINSPYSPQYMPLQRESMQ
ncbi:hypothetical protein E2C01_056727 [Portunus trituberculatus]|uniref:Uncharacterized protein n=1 Tax=Portunus trituberculatus TaxID=210409 RepID=A0A5B7H0E1_PORTR|nr:hypothetical protein [Portunus trituberculatus]